MHKKDTGLICPMESLFVCMCPPSLPLYMYIHVSPPSPPPFLIPSLNSSLCHPPLFPLPLPLPPSSHSPIPPSLLPPPLHSPQVWVRVPLQVLQLWSGEEVPVCSVPGVPRGDHQRPRCWLPLWPGEVLGLLEILQGEFLLEYGEKI